MPMAVYVRDPLLRVRRDYRDPTTPLEQVQKELAQEEGANKEEHLTIFQLHGKKGKDRTSKDHWSPHDG